MLYYMLYSEGLDAIARHYIRQQADDPTAHDRWQAEFDRLCDGYSGHLQDWDKVFAQYCPTVEQRQAAFAKFAKLLQAVLDADPTTLPRRDIGLAPRGWLDCQARVLPYSTSWEKARREAVAVLGYTDRGQL